MSIGRAPLPSRERGWGEGANSFQGGKNRLQNSLRIPQNLVIPEAQDAKPLGNQPGIAFRIVSRFVMLPTIRLNDQSCSQIDEISNVRAYRLLSLELAAGQAMPAQVPPEQPFGVGHVLAEGLSEGKCSRFSPSPQPLSRRGRGAF